MKVRPFLKWLGNKYNCLDKIHPHLEPRHRLIEPFAGSGAVFLNTDYQQYILGEQNKDLVSLYNLLSSDGIKFINYTKKLFIPENNNEDAFYELRSRFNQTKSKKFRSALFIYLNRHGYNGLCRYNSSGGFNVPFGRYNKPYFPEKELLHFHKKSQRAEFHIADFQTTMAKAEEGDIVYCDPPYLPLSDSAYFTQYTQHGFGNNEQMILAKIAEELANKNITVVISNHDTPKSRELYRNATVYSFEVKRFVSCKANNRKPVKELVAIYR